MKEHPMSVVSVISSRSGLSNDHEEFLQKFVENLPREEEIDPKIVDSISRQLLIEFNLRRVHSGAVRGFIRDWLKR